MSNKTHPFKLTVRIIVGALLVIIALSFILSCYTIIPSGYTGVKTTFGQISSDIVPNGICWLIPMVQEVQKVNNKQQEITFHDQIWGESSDRTVVYMQGVTVTYRINPDYSAWLYANVNNYQQNALPDTLVSSAMKAAMVSLGSTEVTNRTKIEPQAVKCLQDAINNKYNDQPVLSIISISINQMDFESDYNDAIAKKQLAQIAYEQTQIENQAAVSVASREAEQRKITAQAEADAILTKAKAEAEANQLISASLTNELINYEKVEKWDGVLPKVTGSNALIGIDMAENDALEN